MPFKLNPITGNFDLIAKGFDADIIVVLDSAVATLDGNVLILQ